MELSIIRVKRCDAFKIHSNGSEMIIACMNIHTNAILHMCVCETVCRRLAERELTKLMWQT